MPSRRLRFFLTSALVLGAGALLILGSVGEERSSPAPVSIAQPELEPAHEPRTAEKAPAGVTLDDPALRASLERIAERALEQTRRPALEDVVKTARVGGPRDLLVALESHLRTAPEDGAQLIECMRSESDATVLFIMARALSRTLDDPAIRAVTLRLLRDSEPARQADALVALMGRSDPEVVALLLEVLEGDPSSRAHTRSAGLLAYVLDKVDPADAQRARWHARAILATPQSTGQSITAAAELLGRPGAAPQDLELLQSELRRTDDPEVLASLAYGLAAGGLPPAGLRELLHSRLEEPALTRTVTRLLAALP